MSPTVIFFYIWVFYIWRVARLRLTRHRNSRFGKFEFGGGGGGEGFVQRKSQKINKTHRVHAPKFQGRVFSEGSEAPQAVHHTRTLLGDPRTGKKIQKS